MSLTREKALNIANVLTEALPYIQRFTGKTIVAPMRIEMGVETVPYFSAGASLLALILVAVHVVALSLLAWDALPFGRSVGFLRHLAVLAPALALTAAWRQAAGDQRRRATGRQARSMAGPRLLASARRNSRTR